MTSELDQLSYRNLRNGWFSGIFTIFTIFTISHLLKHISSIHSSNFMSLSNTVVYGLSYSNFSDHLASSSLLYIAVNLLFPLQLHYHSNCCSVVCYHSTLVCISEPLFSSSTFLLLPFLKCTSAKWNPEFQLPWFHLNGPSGVCALSLQFSYPMSGLMVQTMVTWFMRRGLNAAIRQGYKWGKQKRSWG